MPGASSTNLGSAEEHVDPISTPTLSKTYTCTSCQISFDNGQEQRVHMKHPWHLYNLKRRIAALPPIALDAFETQIETKHDSKERVPNHRREDGVKEDSASDDDEEQDSWPFRCLFCSHGFANDDNGLADNLEHMHAVHGMFVPDSHDVADIQSFLGYLATEVRAWHECLYCGATKHSTQSIQSHMRDKGHCLLNLDREPELLEFWNKPPLGADSHTLEQNLLSDPSTTEIYFASGKVVGSKYATLPANKEPRKSDVALSIREPSRSASEERQSGAPMAEPVEPRVAPGRQLARRDEMSLIGVSLHQRQALVLAEKKAQRSEAMARRAREWVYAKGANLQKYDQVDTKMKMGKQNHKLQPR